MLAPVQPVLFTVSFSLRCPSALYKHVEYLFAHSHEIVSGLYLYLLQGLGAHAAVHTGSAVGEYLYAQPCCACTMAPRTAVFSMPVTRMVASLEKDDSPEA